MNNSWEDRIKKRLFAFLKEFKDVCKDLGRNPENIKILFATKYLNPQQFVAFINILKSFDTKEIILGENRVQEAEMKLDYLRQERPELRKGIEFVLIGTLQRNKINKAIALFDEIHSIDSLGLAKDLDERLKKADRTMDVYLEVNVSGETSKHGIRPEELEETISTMKSRLSGISRHQSRTLDESEHDAVIPNKSGTASGQLSHVTMKGFMTMAPRTENLGKVRGVFRKLQELATRYNLKTSMGMSSDWKAAIEEGSDMIRIGSKIFT